MAQPYADTPESHPDPGFAGTMDSGRQRRIQRLQTLGYWLDDRFRIPGIGMRIGLDGILGFVPGIGDTAMLALSAWIVAEAWRLGVPKRTLGRHGGQRWAWTMRWGWCRWSATSST